MLQALQLLESLCMCAGLYSVHAQTDRRCRTRCTCCSAGEVRLKGGAINESQSTVRAGQTARVQQADRGLRAGGAIGMHGIKHARAGAKENECVAIGCGVQWVGLRPEPVCSLAIFTIVQCWRLVLGRWGAVTRTVPGYSLLTDCGKAAAGRVERR
ncbi:hypothetical protein K437DRAFT_15840 [Tilletiaria anomala UBC 951]|uniref:Secreted protein n=1 Tax=Tilletiaria anomala (strain ATCC 24038 / CBS 436.72 / UBC 951) TaxID=1037660 RepID=A0A066WMT9_TILAU|nr:uncharacterized protein K437DRAFT_15840 [Tilletiaria anomala UBC 951]KDN52314.1 hypothetical protein K437DRAFT_15840 [Tilletiaria anomala UBC 951]